MVNADSSLCVSNFCKNWVHFDIKKSHIESYKQVANNKTFTFIKPIKTF